MAERWTNLDYERARKYLFKEATSGETTTIRNAMNAVQSQAPNSVSVGKYYLDRLDAISLTIDQLSTQYAGVKTRPDGEGILEYWQGEPYETLRASGRGFVKALEKLTGLVAEGDFFQSPEARDFEISQVIGLTSALAGKADLVEGKVPLAQLPPTSDSGHSSRTDNPHSTTYAQVGAAPASHTHVDLQQQSDLLDDIISGFSSATEGQVIAKQGTALAYATASGGAPGGGVTHEQAISYAIALG